MIPELGIFNVAAREFGAPYLEAPEWEANPALFPFKNGTEWNKNLGEDFVFDPVNGPPDVVSWVPDSGTATGTVDLSGASVGVAFARNTKLALRFDGVDTLFTDTDPTTATMGTEWTVYTAFRPRRFTFDALGIDADGDGLWTANDYFFGQSMVNDGSGDVVRLYAFEGTGTTAYSIDLPVFSGRWVVTTAKLDRAALLHFNLATDTPVTEQLPTPPAPGVNVIQFGQNPPNARFGFFDIGAWAVAPSGSQPETRVRDIQRYLEAVYGPTLKCLVLIDGKWSQVPATAPFGKRVIMTAGEFEMDPDAGKSLLLDNGRFVEAADEVDVKIPPKV